MVKRKTPDTLTVEQLKEELHYDPPTGVWTWLYLERKGKRWNKQYSGKQAGYIANTDSYVRIWLRENRYLAHRLAWFYMTGEWPREIDHKNRIRFDNSWPNLRDVTTSENHRNMPKNATNKSGITGVRFDERDKLWVAECSNNGVKERVSGKSFARIVAWRKAKEKEFGYDPSHGLEKKSIHENPISE